MIIITIGHARQPRYAPSVLKGQPLMFHPNIYGIGTLGWFKNKRQVYYYECREWAGASWGSGGIRTTCSYKGREDIFIRHLIDFHGSTEEEATEYIKHPRNAADYRTS